MKHIVPRLISLFFLIFFSLVVVSNMLIHAQTPTSTRITPTPTTQPGLNEEVQKIKEKIASKVDELRKESKTVVSGYVQDRNENVITLLTSDTTKFSIALDDTVTKVYTLSGTTKQETDFAALERDVYIVVSGFSLENTVNANTIYIDTNYNVVTGKVTDLDAKNFAVEMLTTEKDQYTFDVEQSTKQLMLTPDTKLATTGFSKIKVGDTITIVFEASTDPDETRFSALRLVLVPQEYFTPNN